MEGETMIKNMNKKVLEYYATGNPSWNKEYKTCCYSVPVYNYFLVTPTSIVDISDYGLPNILVEIELDEYSLIGEQVYKYTPPFEVGDKKIRLNKKIDMYRWNSKTWGLFNIEGVTIIKAHMFSVLSMIGPLNKLTPKIDLYIGEKTVKIYVEDKYFATLIGI